MARARNSSRMKQNADLSFDFTEKHEGRYSGRRDDGGNWTGGRMGHGTFAGSMRGISAPLLAEWLGDAALVDAARMKAVTAAEFRVIARAKFWNTLWCDRLPSGVDLMMFDFGFNAGVHGALTELSGLFGAHDRTDIMSEDLLRRLTVATNRMLIFHISRRWAEDLQEHVRVNVDGRIGPVTLEAVGRSGGRDLLLIAALATAQEAAYRRDRGFTGSGDGWLARLSDRVDLAFQWSGRDAASAAA
ncbi:glycosyl hydrolase 108 family protein [Acetobacter fallax]|uniref:TtsA-like Glycoside hydrolase family 108 domain-containing protein n=1 Tax=Acetobacter fallax TaxID=1737473 RepID=A0ABX0KDY7_9PROT|nr:glycosyl hydrolase 108 family protein [Acetobacter fallax]NHO33311.1 hypothetical protein [Acetobacter fallax]NHO36932.1 hypothetical protein [Acetobacter fallax]